MLARDFGLTGTQRGIWDLAAGFVDAEIVPHSREWDRAEQASTPWREPFPRHIPPTQGRKAVDRHGSRADSDTMALRLSKQFARQLGELRFEPTPKRVRAIAGEATVADTRRAVLVWEPKRVVPSYAVPEEDLHATIAPSEQAAAAEHPVPLDEDSPQVLDPRTAFAAHTSEGNPVSLRAGARSLAGAGFRPADPDLAGYVVLDFAAFDQWLEEDEPIVGHPRDPYSRIDVRRSSSRVRIEVDGVPLAESTSALLLFETHITPRFYLPRADVRMDLLRPSDTTSVCAYKGFATYFSAEVGGRSRPDIAWTYSRPLAGLTEIAGHVCFFDERVDIVLDGVSRSRPVTPWS